MDKRWDDHPSLTPKGKKIQECLWKPRNKDGWRLTVKCWNLSLIIHRVSVSYMRNAHGHNFNGTQYSVTNKMKQHSICYHFLLCATSGNANVAQQDIIEHFKKREYSILKLFFLTRLWETLKQSFTHAVHCCTGSPFGGEAVSEITQLFAKVDTKTYKQDKWVFCFVLHWRTSANARCHDKHFNVLEKSREDQKLLKLLWSILRKKYKLWTPLPHHLLSSLTK